MMDELGRRINYLRISVTDRCNLRCRYCMPEEGIAKKDHEAMMTLEEAFEVVRACAALGIDKVRITGGEPLVRKGIVNLIERIAGLSTVKDIALTTNGILLKQYAYDLKQAGLKRINVSLDTLDEEKYRHITRGGDLKQTMAGLQEAQRVGLVPVKLNTVLVGGFNENEVDDFLRLTIDEPADVRFIELMPLGQAGTWAKEHFVSNGIVLEKHPELILLENEDKSSPAKYYRLPGAKGRIGFINPISHQFCCYCNRIRLTADGKLKPCLHSNQEIDVKSILRHAKPEERERLLSQAVQNAVKGKPEQHGLNEVDSLPIERDMFRIGG